jgi:hypothetical protein
MAYRDRESLSLADRVAEMERRLRNLEQPGALPPDPGWVLREVDNCLRYLYVPTGTLGPEIGAK